MGNDLSIVLQTCVPSPDGLVQAFEDAGLVKNRDPLCYIELRVMKADAAIQFISNARAATSVNTKDRSGASAAASRNQVSLLVANCYSYVVGSSTSKAASGGGGGGEGASGGNSGKDDEQDAVYGQVRRAVRHESSCGKRIGLVIDASVQLGDRVQDPQQGYRFARGTTYFLSSLLTALEYDVPRDEEVWTLSESPAPTLYLLDVRDNALDDFAGPWLVKDILERVRRVRHHALTVRRQQRVHTRIAQRHGQALAGAPPQLRLPPPPKMTRDSVPDSVKSPGSPLEGSDAARAEQEEPPRRASASSYTTTDIMAAMDGQSENGAEDRSRDALAKKDLIFDVPIYMPNVRSDLFIGSLQCVLLADNDLTLNGVDLVLTSLFETEQLASERAESGQAAHNKSSNRIGGALAGATAITRTQRSPRPSRGQPPSTGAPSGTAESADEHQLVVASDAATLLLPYLILIDVRRNAFDERDAEVLLQRKVGAVVDARDMTVLDAPGKPPPALSALEKQRIALEKKKEERRLQKEEAKRRKEEKKKTREEEQRRLLEARRRAQKEKEARQREREAAEEARREAEKRELLAAMEALTRQAPISATRASTPMQDALGGDEEDEEVDPTEVAARRAAPSDAGQWLDDEGGLVTGDAPEERAAPPPPLPSSSATSTTDARARPHSLSPRSPKPTGAPPSWDQQPAPTPKKRHKVRALSADLLADDPNAPPQLKDKAWSPHYARRSSRTPRQPHPTVQSHRTAPATQRSPAHAVMGLASVTPPPPSPAPANPSATPTRGRAADHLPTTTTAGSPTSHSAASLSVRSSHGADEAAAGTPSLPSRRSTYIEPLPPSPSSSAAPPAAKARAKPAPRTAAALAEPLSRPSASEKRPTTPRAAQTAPSPATPQTGGASASPAPVAPARRSETSKKPGKYADIGMDDDSEDEDSDLGDEDLLWGDPCTGEALWADPDYSAVPNEAPDIVRARRSYSRGRGQTPRRLMEVSKPVTPPPLPTAPPLAAVQEVNFAASGSMDEPRHTHRKSRWSEEPEEKRFNEGVVSSTTPYERALTTDAPHSHFRRSVAGLPPMAPSSSRRSASGGEHHRDGADGSGSAFSGQEHHTDQDDDDHIDEQNVEADEEEDEPVFDISRPKPAARPLTSRKPSKTATSQVNHETDPHAHAERQSIRRDSAEEREWKAEQRRQRQLRDAPRNRVDDSTIRSEPVPPATTTTGIRSSVDDNDDWARDVYDAADPDVWGPPFKPPPREKKNKKRRATEPSAPVSDEDGEVDNMHKGEGAERDAPYDAADPDVWGPPFKAPAYDAPKKEKQKSHGKPAYEASEEDDRLSGRNPSDQPPDAAYDPNDPDVWGPPYQPPKRKPSVAARSRRATNASAQPNAEDGANSPHGTRRSSYVVPCSTATSRMRAFYGQQLRTQQEQTASRDARLRLAARPATIDKDSDVFRTVRKETFVDPGRQELEGVEVDQSGVPLDDAEQPVDRYFSVVSPAPAGRAPSQFKRYDSAKRPGGRQPRGGAPGGLEWNYQFPASPSRAGPQDDKSGDQESLAEVRQSSPSPRPYMADVLPRDDVVQTPSVSPSSHALGSPPQASYVPHSRSPASAGHVGSSLRDRPSVIRPGLGYVPPHPKIRTRTRSMGTRP